MYTRLSLNEKWTHLSNKADNPLGKYGLMSVFFRLPEVPPDTAETNPIMRHNEIHKFSQLTPDAIVTGCAKMSLEFISKFDDLVESIGGKLYDVSLKRQWLRNYC